MYDGSSDPYDHMLHFNQVMILNAGDDHLLCKVFPTILKGPALAWFHKLPQGSINSFSELWAAFLSQYLCLVQLKGNISSLQTILSRKMSPSVISPEDLGESSNKLIHIVWMQSSKISEGALGRPHHSSIHPPWIRLQQWNNCTDGQINIRHWKIISRLSPRS